MTVAEWLEKWLATRSARVSKNTVISYVGIIKKHITPHLGDKKLQALKPVDLRNYYGTLASLGLTPKTMRNIHGVLYGALEDATRLELVMRNSRKPRATRSTRAKQQRQSLSILDSQ